MRRIFRLATVFSLLLVVIDSAADERSLQLTLHSGRFGVSEGRDGLRIEMEGFDYLKRPGKPMLPEKQSLVLLPPGARVLSLEVEELEAERLPGEYSIAPVPPLLPLAGPSHAAEAIKRELERWQESYRAAYADDRAYPARAARIVGSGTLRKYSYVRIAFCPFSYHAASGRLTHHDQARIRVVYELPDADSEKARATEMLLRDTIADGRAADLFVNYDDLRHLYEPADRGEPLRGDGSALHDFVIVTTSGNVDAITASGFPSWKSSLGFNVRMVLTTDPEIAAQPGADLAERIRNFLRANYVPWGIEHVLLVGAYADVPMRYCYPDPGNHLHDPWDPGTGPGSVPTDAYYADLSFPDADSWDLDGDGFHGEYGQDDPDFLNEVNVGRIPTSIDSRITYTLDKLVRYEQDTGPWKRHALHAGAVLFYENQNGDDIPFRDGAVCVDEIETHFMQGWTIHRYSEREGLVPSSYPWPALSLPAFISDWNAGTYGLVNWAGHGWPDGVYRTIWRWDDGDGIPETDGSDGMESDPFLSDWPLLEDDYPSIVCAVSCDVAYPEPNGSGGNLGVNLLTDPGLGAAAGVMASTRYAAVSRDWPALAGGAESLCYEFNRYLIAAPGGFRTLGAAVHESKFSVHVDHGWDSEYELRNMYNYNLYGDPSMDWRGAGTRTADLLRNTEIHRLDPVSPPLGDILPLDPADDLHITNFVAGEVDPDPAGGCPLVFYEIDAPVWIWLDKTPSGEIRIDF